MKTNLRIVASAALLLTSCSTDLGTSYTASDVGQARTTLRGTVRRVRVVTIKGEGMNAGAAVGTGAGALAGALIGGSEHRLLGAALGGAAGLAGGQAVGRQIAKKKGYEYEVLANNGIVYTMVQGPNVVLQVGDQVTIVLPNNGRPGKLIPLN
ncbi:hypothetical protein AGMMS49949_09790 [Alphaproteobacteria bacterium]|nr:hypothetical protein AGMMS49949_09790 [Alphaproteobacteria bacterium]GHS97470.1 hypothetical protein AGMMS50296_4460 [Alphaproteobacteria bacterium]